MNAFMQRVLEAHARKVLDEKLLQLSIFKGDRQQSTPLSAPAKSSELSPPEKLLTPETQFPLKTASTNSKAISQPTITNR